MAFKLPRLQWTTEIVTQTRTPAQALQVWWNVVAGAIEQAVFDLSETLARLTTAEGAIDALAARTITAGNGLTGGGDLSADRTFNVGAGAGISVSADAVTNTGVLSFSGGATGLTPASGATGDVALAGILALVHGGTGADNASAARANLGATTLGGNVFTIANPSAITFPRFNADNTVSALDASAFRTAIGAGTGGGSVTSVAALTIGTTGTNITSSVANPTITPVITLNIPDASASNRGALTAANFTLFNNKQDALVSGTNIRTVGGVSLLGSGDIGRPSFTSTIAIGAATASLSGAGISFPATQSPSTDPNTLDDYEEGTWTPTVTAVSGTLTSYTSSGTYTKIGRVVIATGVVAITNNGTGAVALNATLPFANNAAVSYYGSGRELGIMFVQLMVEVPLAQSYAQIARYDGAYPGGTGSEQRFTVVYTV